MPQLSQTEDGHYVFLSNGKPKGDNLYTAYVAFPELYGDNEPVEEIDLLAPSQDTAYAVAAAALERDYEPGGKVVRVVYRTPGVMYL